VSSIVVLLQKVRNTGILFVKELLNVNLVTILSQINANKPHPIFLSSLHLALYNPPLNRPNRDA
jgi:hypothetical protein